jgi:hypothetical protein
MRTVVSAGLVALALLIDVPSGASAQPENPFALNVTIGPNSRAAGARVLRARAYSTEAGVVIRGDVGFPNRIRNGVFSGHVDAQIRAADGSEFTLHDGTVHGRSKPKAFGRRGFFTVKVPTELPAGGSAFVSYVEARHPTP